MQIQRRKLDTEKDVSSLRGAPQFPLELYSAIAFGMKSFKS